MHKKFLRYAKNVITQCQPRNRKISVLCSEGHMPLSLAVTESAGDKSLHVTTESSQ